MSSQPDRADRYLETEPNIPIATPPTNPKRGVKGKPTSAIRPVRASAAEPDDPPLHVFDNGICMTCEGGA